MFDVAVIGDGPSGAAAALTLASAGRSVIVVGRGELGVSSIGEVLSPEVGSLLIQLGAWEAFLASGPQPAHGIWSAWGGQGLIAKDFVASPHGPAWRVNRARFDETLLCVAEKRGVRVGRGFRRTAVRRVGRNWHVDAYGNQGDLSVQSRFVVDATGRSASIARAHGAKWVVHDRLVALVALLRPRLETTVLAADVLLVESVPAGWWYSVVLPDGDLVATFLTDADLVRERVGSPLQAWSEALDATAFTALRAAGFTRSRFCVQAAGIGCLDRATGTDWVAVGNAASTVDPLSGIGIAKALQSGILAADAVHRSLSSTTAPLDAYAIRTQEEYDAYLRTAAAFYSSEQRWPQSTFWRRRRKPGYEEVVHGDQ